LKIGSIVDGACQQTEESRWELENFRSKNHEKLGHIKNPQKKQYETGHFIHTRLRINCE